VSDEPIDRKFVAAEGIKLDPSGEIAKRMANVVPFQKPDDSDADANMQRQLEAAGFEIFVTDLENYGGDLEQLCSKYANLVPGKAELLFKIEKWLRQPDNKELLKRWKLAIKLNQIVRLRLLQDKALGLLEEPEKSVLKLSEVVSYAKLVLGDFLASQLTAAKKPPIVMPDGTVVEQEDDDDAAAERAMADA
jgi:hypothetical protein